MGNIAKTIRKYRIMHKLTQSELAERANQIAEDGKYSAAIIAGYESGRRIPKIDVRMVIAKALGADPIALSGVELNDIDEIRLLMKLLLKYSNQISINDDGTVKAVLPNTFAGFAWKLNKTKEKYNSLSDMEITENTLDNHNFSKEEEIEFYTEMYPKFDPIVILKENQKKVTIDNIQAMDKVLEPSFLGELYRYQESCTIENE